MPNKLGRRDFLRTSAAGAMLGSGLTAAARANSRPIDRGIARDTSRYSCAFYPFEGHPKADTCWSVSTGPDGRIYASSCAEGVPGGTVKVFRYNDETDSLDMILDLAEAVDDPGDSGRATQCKIHYSFAPSMHDNVLYMATHLSGPPVDLPLYSPWLSWHDEKRRFRGAALVAYDTKTDKPLWWDTLIPYEGCRCLLHDEDRQLLYALGYPRDHFIIYDLKKRQRRDLGRIGSVNAQALFLDKRHRVWTTNDDGRLVRYDPDRDRLELSPFQLPHNPLFQTGWHSVFYDVVADPASESLFATTWIAQPYLMRIWPNEGDWPRVENLGPATQDRDLSFPVDTFCDHCGGLTVGGDGCLYYVAARWRDPIYNPMPADRPEREGVVWRLNPKTMVREEAIVLKHPNALSQYVSRGAVDKNGNLFFGFIGGRPVGIFKVTVPKRRQRANAHLPIRMWG